MSADLTETMAALRQHEKYCDSGHGAYSALLSAVENVLALCDDTGGPDSWSHMFDGHQSVFVADVLKALTDALGVQGSENSCENSALGG